MYERMNAELGELRERLRGVPVDDRETWARVARHTAGAFAAWSNAIEDEPGDLARASDILSRSAQTWRTPIKPKPTSMGSLAGTAMLLTSAARGGQGLAAQVIMIRQLANLAKAVYDAARANGELRQAQAQAGLIINPEAASFWLAAEMVSFDKKGTRPMRSFVKPAGGVKCGSATPSWRVGGGGFGSGSSQAHSASSDTARATRAIMRRSLRPARR